MRLTELENEDEESDEAPYETADWSKCWSNESWDRASHQESFEVAGTNGKENSSPRLPQHSHSLVHSIPRNWVDDGVIFVRTPAGRPRLPGRRRPLTTLLPQFRPTIPQAGKARRKTGRVRGRETDVVIPRAAFTRLVRDVLYSISPCLRIQSGALGALQSAGEAYLVGVFEDTNLLALHTRRVTVRPPDLLLARAFRASTPLV